MRFWQAGVITANIVNIYYGTKLCLYIILRPSRTLPLEICEADVENSTQLPQFSWGKHSDCILQNLSALFQERSAPGHGMGSEAAQWEMFWEEESVWPGFHSPPPPCGEHAEGHSPFPILGPYSAQSPPASGAPDNLPP